MKELLFVYNADAGLVNAMVDSVHKMISPGTYQCQLCTITHGLVGMRKGWRQALERFDLPSRFLHRDEFRKAYPERHFTSPSVWLINGTEWRLLLGATDWDKIQSITDLQSVLTSLLTEE